MNHCGEFGAAICARQHEADLVVEGARVVLGVEIAALPAPIGPGAGEPVEDLLARWSRRRVRSSLGSAASAASSATGATAKAARRSPRPRFSRAGTPALRKYFWARMSQATWLHSAGTSIPSAEKTTEPSGLRISLLVVRKSSAAYGL